MTDSKNRMKRETDQNPSLTMILKRVVFLTLELLLLGGYLCAQDSSIAGGTLNVVLANKHGFVLATDSRMTAVNGHYTDDSQKLFRIGKHSALVIAGFASASAPGTPLDTQVARLLRGQFSREQDLDFDGPDLKEWMNVAMSSQLQTIGSVLGTFGYTQMEMTAIAAGYDVKKKPRIMRFDFKPTYKLISGATLPDFDTVITTTDVTKFTYATSGITEIAESILSGTYPSSDPTILRYLAAKQRRRLDVYPLFELRKLAKVILAETEKHTRYVGGPDQTILIPSKGNAVLDSPVFPTTTQRPLRTFLFRGLPSNIKLTTAKEVATMGFSGPFKGDSGEPVTQVFVGGALKDVDVSLDGNIFAGFTFLGATFKYKGGSFWFDNNRVQDCVLEVEEGTTISPDNPLMSKCTLVHRKHVDGGPNAVGRPFKNTCAVKDENGQVRNEERASCPAGSQTVLMLFMPIPPMRSQPPGEPAK